MQPSLASGLVSPRAWLAAIAALCFGLGLYQYDDMCEAMPDGSFLKSFLNGIEIAALGPGLGISTFVLMRYLDLRERVHCREVAIEHERRFQMLGRIATSVAHEIRNPLHNLRLIEEGLHASPGDERLLGRLHTSLERLDQAVRLVYELSRPRPTTRAELERVFLDQMVSSVSEDTCQSSQAHRVRNLIGESAPGIAVRARPQALRMILANLIRNALEVSSSDQVTIDVEIQGEVAVVVVSNPGELRSEGLAAPSSKPDGLGVGLFIATHLATSIFGRLSLSSSDGLVIARLALIKDSDE